MPREAAPQRYPAGKSGEGPCCPAFLPASFGLFGCFGRCVRSRLAGVRFVRRWGGPTRAADPFGFVATLQRARIAGFL
jgi:hypothetical protein